MDPIYFKVFSYLPDDEKSYDFFGYQKATPEHVGRYWGKKIKVVEYYGTTTSWASPCFWPEVAQVRLEGAIVANHALSDIMKEILEGYHNGSIIYGVDFEGGLEP